MAGGGGGDGKTPHIDLVPILDAMTGVIFFLILSSTFIELTKITLPPATTSTITDPVAPPPISAKIFALVDDVKIKLVINWSGAEPGKLVEELPRENLQKNKSVKPLEDAASRLIDKFKDKYPNEKTIQLGFSEKGNYQEMISVMDGIRKKVSDIVLISYNEASLVEAGLPTEVK